MSKQAILVIVAFTLLSGCASKGDMEQLKAEMELFKEAYDSKLHVQLNKNLKEAEAYYKGISRISNEVESLEELLSGLATSSEEYYGITRDNAKTSTAINIANEFSVLKKRWESTISEMESSTNLMQRLASDTEVSARQAKEYARATAADADRIDDLNRKINKLNLIMGRVEVSLEELEGKSVPESEKIKNLAKLYQKLSARFLKIEKKQQEILSLNSNG